VVVFFFFDFNKQSLLSFKRSTPNPRTALDRNLFMYLLYLQNSKNKKRHLTPNKFAFNPKLAKVNVKPRFNSYKNMEQSIKLYDFNI